MNIFSFGHFCLRFCLSPCPLSLLLMRQGWELILMTDDDRVCCNVTFVSVCIYLLGQAVTLDCYGIRGQIFFLSSRLFIYSRSCR